jgi:DNA-binding CsgD family transcriptional regulator
MGIEAFAERARRELRATGETSDELAAQQAQTARLARDGLSNPEIGTRLFISPRTVQPDWPHALCTGGYERGPARMTLGGMRSPDECDSSS